jgi:hypothetical protein
MIDGATTILLLAAAALATLCTCWLAEEVAYRWRCWQRGQMTRWQRRVQAGLEAPPGFGVIPPASRA